MTMIIRFVIGVITTSIAAASALLVDTHEQATAGARTSCVTAELDDGSSGWFCEGQFIARHSELDTRVNFR